MGQVEIGRDAKHQPILLTYSDVWSFQNFTNKRNVFQGRGKELDGLVVYSTTFYQEARDVDIFPSDVQNLTLAFCNLDNVKIPAGVTLIQCSTRRLQVQNDLRDWELNDKNLPVKVTNEAYEKSLGRSIDPTDIPPVKIQSIDELDPVNPSIDVIPVDKQEPEAQKLATVLKELLKQPDLEASRADLVKYVDYVLGKEAVAAIKAGG